MTKKIDLEKCKYYFDFDENGNLYWKHINENWKNKKAVVGSIAGSISKRGYINVRIETEMYKAHRILYQLYHNIELKQNEEIDHIDRNNKNNSKENLRIATRSENSHNTKMRKDNKTTGIKNISIVRYGTVEYYHLNIRKNNIGFSKCFRVDRHALEDIIKIRDKMILELHGEFMCKG